LIAFLVALALVVVSIWMGLPGWLAGRRMTATRGPETLMHYPVHLPWLAGRLNTARRVTALGAFYMGVGQVTAAVAVLVGLASNSGEAVPPCLALAPPDEVAGIAGAPVEVAALWQQGPRCLVQLRTPQSDQVLVEVEVTASAALIGAEFADQRADLTRSAYTIQSLPRLGKEAVLAFNPALPEQATIMLFRHGEATARVTVAAHLGAATDPTPWTDLLLLHRAQMIPGDG
jgi:hypothetical protein